MIEEETPGIAVSYPFRDTERILAGETACLREVSRKE